MGRKRGDIPSMHCGGMFKFQAISVHFLLCYWGRFLKARERFPCSFKSDGFIVKTLRFGVTSHAVLAQSTEHFVVKGFYVDFVCNVYIWPLFRKKELTATWS